MRFMLCLLLLLGCATVASAQDPYATGDRMDLYNVYPDSPYYWPAPEIAPYTAWADDAYVEYMLYFSAPPMSEPVYQYQWYPMQFPYEPVWPAGPYSPGP